MMPLCDMESHIDTGRICAVVLGGGRGERLYPLTALRAKPAVPLLGRYRLVDIPLSNCIASGVRQIFVLTQFNSASLNRHVSDTYRFDVFSSGFIEVLAAEQTVESRDWYQGTADAVRKQLRHIKNLHADQCLVLSGDQLYRMDYRSFLATHLRNNADVTVATLPVDRDAAPRFGIMKVGTRGRIRRFVEKPSDKDELQGLETPRKVLADAGVECAGAAFLASMGVYLFRMEVIIDALEQHPEWNDFGKDVIPNVLRKHRVVAHLFAGYWEDIGTVRSYYEAHMRMIKPDPPLQFHDPQNVIYTHPRYLPGSRFQDATIRQSLVCEGCRITKAQISNSVIGIRSVIRPRARIERSVVLGADYFEDSVRQPNLPPIGIGAGSIIRNAIVDKNARIGHGVVIHGSKRLKDRDRNGFAIRDGIVVVLKNAVIPDGTRIE